MKESLAFLVQISISWSMVPSSRFIGCRYLLRLEYDYPGQSCLYVCERWTEKGRDLKAVDFMAVVVAHVLGCILKIPSWLYGLRFFSLFS